MNLAFRLKMAKQSAEKLLRDEGMAALPIDPIVIAAGRDIEVQPKPGTANGVSGMLLRHGNNFGILYATHVASAGFQRFSIAHELGHYFLDGHIDHVLPRDGIHTSHAGFVSADPYELEADSFAAGLLMPEELFRRSLAKSDPGLATVERMAEQCGTSLTAAAIRCAELSDHALAIVISTGPTIDFCFLSEAMKSLPDITWIRKGVSVPAGTATARLNAKPTKVMAAERAAEEVDSLDWFNGSRSAMLAEEVIGLGQYGKTLTVLSSTSLASKEEGYEVDDDEDDLIESWTPRHHR